MFKMWLIAHQANSPSNSTNTNSSSSLKFVRSCSQLQSEGCIKGPSFSIQLALGISCKIISVCHPDRQPQRSFTWENPKCAPLFSTLVLQFRIHLLVRWQNWPVPKFWGWETSTEVVQIRSDYCKCSLIWPTETPLYERSPTEHFNVNLSEAICIWKLCNLPNVDCNTHTWYENAHLRMWNMLYVTVSCWILTKHSFSSFHISI